MLRIAGMRINPKTNGLHNTTFNSSLSLRKIPEGKIDLPVNARLTPGRWSPDATRFTFTNTTERGIELWLGDTTGKTRKIEGVRASTPSWAAAVADAAAWAPAPPRCSGCPTARHSSFRWSNPTAAPSPTSHWSPPGRTYRKASAAHRPRSPMRTCCGIRTTKISSSIYATSQLTLVDAATGKTPPIGKAGIVESARISPDGRYLLVTTIHRPFSYLHDARAFPKEIEIWDRSGKVIHNIASSPLEDRVPINGVITGPRSLQWRPNAPATLMWVEALDNGDLKIKVPHRDRLLALAAPFTAEPHEIVKTEQRFTRYAVFRKRRARFCGRFRAPDAPRAHLPD